MVLDLQGRPKGVTPKYSLKPLVPRLSELLGVNVSEIISGMNKFVIMRIYEVFSLSSF